MALGAGASDMVTPKEKAEAVLDALEDCRGRWEGANHCWVQYSEGYEFCYYCDAIRATKKVTDGDE